MKLKILWPGKTRNRDLKGLQEYYFQKINHLEKCEIVEIKEAKGIAERYARRIKDVEAAGFEKQLKDEYIICLSHKGREMNSVEFARFLKKIALGSASAISFVVGGFLGLDERILKRADFLLSLSKMTFSHELSRVLLLEQIYRSLSILKGTQYAK